MPRPKALTNLSADELKALAEEIAAEEARRKLLSSGSEAIKGVVESIRTVANNLKVTPADLLNPIVEAIMGDGHAVYAKRGRAAAKATGRKPGRPRKVK